jgi:hypothetical protein
MVTQASDVHVEYLAWADIAAFNAKHSFSIRRFLDEHVYSNAHMSPTTDPQVLRAET